MNSVAIPMMGGIIDNKFLLCYHISYSITYFSYNGRGVLRLNDKIIKFRHTKESIQALSRAQFWAVNRNNKAMFVFVCILCIALGALMIETSSTAVLMLALGVVVLVIFLKTPERNAKQVIDQLKGKYPSVSYSCKVDAMQADFDGQPTFIFYDDITALSEDNRYCYVTLETKQMYIAPKADTSGIDAWKKRLASATGLQWKKRRGLLTASIWDVVENWKAGRSRIR